MYVTHVFIILSNDIYAVAYIHLLCDIIAYYSVPLIMHL